MKKYFTLLLTLFIVCDVSNAGLITHTDYTAGNVITAAGQNTNENTIVNEFNGNIDNTNIKTGGVTSTNILDGTIVTADLNSSLSSTFTYVNSLGAYRRPVLVRISATAVDVENNTGIANQTCIHFPDIQRCVTEDTSSTSVNRRFIITEAASFTGTKNSGLTGASASADTWYNLYAVKVQDNSTDFVISGTTVAPTQANYSVLNTMYQLNGWVYLGKVPYGNNGNALTSIPSFIQQGNITTVAGSLTGAVADITGIRLSSTSATSLTWSYASGTTIPSIPSDINQVWVTAIMASDTTSIIVKDSGNSLTFYQGPSGTNNFTQFFLPYVQLGVRIAPGSGGTKIMEVILNGWVDPHLTSGYNPQL